MRGKTFVAAGAMAMLLAGCNNDADVEERFQEFATDYTPQEISHDDLPSEGGVEFNLKDDIYVRQYTRDTLFDRGEMQLSTRFKGPADEEFIDDYVALLEFSMESPEETGFEFKRMVEDIIEQREPSSEYYFTGDISVNMQNLPEKCEEVIDVHVNHHLAKDVFGDRPEQLREEGFEERLEPMPKYLEMTGNEDGVPKKVSRLISHGLSKMSGYIEYGDDPDIDYYNRLPNTLESLIPQTEQTLEVVEDEAIKKDVEETLDLLQDLDKQAEDMDSYAENESIVRLDEIYRDLDHYVRRNFYIEPTNTTHFAEKVKEAQPNE